MSGGWLTVPEWAAVRPRDVFRVEGEPAPAPIAPQNVHVLARCRMTLPTGDYTLRISADDYYHAWLDGDWLGQGGTSSFSREKKKQKELQTAIDVSVSPDFCPTTDRGGAHCAPQGGYYQSYSLSGGRTVTLALHVYYQGLVNRVWNSGDGRLGFWVQLVQGETAMEFSPERWRCHLCRAYSGDVTGYDTQFLENFDSRLWPEGWEQPGFDDSDWERPVPAQWADYVLFPQPMETLWRGRVEPAASRPIPGGVLLDFGRERVGTLHARARGKAGDQLILRFGEELDQHGRVRYELRCNCRYEETWTLADGESVLHQFDYKAFRYAELLGDAELTECWVWERHYPMEDDLCTLSCGTDQLEDIFRICKNAVRCGSQEGYLDCPTREKGQYLGDAVVTARSQVWLTGKTDLLRKCIGDFLATSRDFPALLGVAPGALRQEVADFSLLFPMLPLTDYQFTGDREFLQSCYPALEKIQKVFAQYQRPDGLLENVSHGWNLVDWPEQARDGYDFPLTRPVVGEGCHNVINALWYGFLLMKEYVERVLGLPRTEESRRVGEAFRRVFYRPAQRLFADSEVSSHCSLHANLYAACFGFTPDADAYERLLLTPGRYCGPLPFYFALRGLARLGKWETLYRLLTRMDSYGWRNMLAEGATACFEAWGKDLKWNTSLCHPWASGAIPVLIEELAGLHPDPDAPGGLRMEPHLPDHLTDFRLRVPFRGRAVEVGSPRQPSSGVHF